MKPPNAVPVIPSVRVFIAGNSGSGKSTRAWSMYLERYPRRIISDQTGEYAERADADCGSVEDAVQAIRDLAPRGRWTVSLALDTPEFRQFINWCIPVPRLDESPIRRMGGAVMLVDEVDLVAATGAQPKEIRTLYRRSRHVGLSVVSATQRPANVSREVSAQSQHIIAHYLSEPRDRDYIADVMRWDKAAVKRWLDWCRRHPHGAVWREVQTGRQLWLPESGVPQPEPTGQRSLAFGSGDASAAKVREPEPEPEPEPDE